MRNAPKVLQSGYYWPTLFKYVFEVVKTCDEYQRATGNTGKRQEMPMNYSMPFTV
jgi:hypothetical protein